MLARNEVLLHGAHPLSVPQIVRRIRITEVRTRRLPDGRSENGDDMAEQTDTTTEQRPNPNEKLVKVFDSEQESEAMEVKRGWRMVFGGWRRRELRHRSA